MMNSWKRCHLIEHKKQNDVLEPVTIHSFINTCSWVSKKESTFYDKPMRQKFEHSEMISYHQNRFCLRHPSIFCRKTCRLWRGRRFRKLSAGCSVRPAYPGFIMKTPTASTSLIWYKTTIKIVFYRKKHTVPHLSDQIRSVFFLKRSRNCQLVLQQQIKSQLEYD